eukprot:5452809-Ditylum_brightwellii.AAC.1
MQETLSPMLENGCNLTEDNITEPPNHTCITPTQVPQGSSGQNGDSCSVATTLTNQIITATLSTTIT